MATTGKNKMEGGRSQQREAKNLECTPPAKLDEETSASSTGSTVTYLPPLEASINAA